jgi:hypothetical protein
MASAAAAVALCGTISAGSAAAGEPRPLDLTVPEVVTLPTGDKVRLLSGGALGLEPAAGREGIAFTTILAADGEGVIVVPGDKAEDLLSGAEDARRYNVTELAEHGGTDAAALAEAELDAFAALPPLGGAAQDPSLTVTARDHSGKFPDGGYVSWYDTKDHENSGTLDFDENGVATADLAPGSYTLTHATWNFGAGDRFTEFVFGVSHVTIGDRHTEHVLDGATAAPVSAEVERPDAEVLDLSAELMASSDVGSVGLGVFGPGGTDIFLMPETDLPGYELDFRYQTTLVSPAGAAEPYQYNLAFGETGGLPDDTSYEVYDEKLAAVATDYTGFGPRVDGYTCDYGAPVNGRFESRLCAVVDTPFPSQRLNLYTATPEIVWNTDTTGGVFDSEGSLLDGFKEETEDTVFTPGRFERSFPHGPLTSGAGEAMVTNVDGSVRLEATVPLGAGRNGEHVDLIGYAGDAELLCDGQRIDWASGDPLEGLTLDVAGSGRYTLSVGGSRETGSGPFAFKSFVEWGFDLAPGTIGPGEQQELVLPAVALTAPDVEGGMTANREQPVTLELTSGTGAGLAAAEMGLEVSYDDGFTWTTVALDVDHENGTATAVLHHPEDAAYVSTRMTATDTAGTEVEQTTIWAYGLS